MNDVRRLAGLGELAAAFAAATGDDRRRLRAAAAEIVWPLVYQRITRPVERRRGHPRCAGSVPGLEPDCLDRFHDDVDAVLDDLLTHADQPIRNLEGWLTTRMRRATVDAHRRRRGERGAPQRPRVPGWLTAGLAGDPWLVELAKAILDWAGTQATAGASLWPLTAWSERRATRTGEHSAGESVVAAEVETVLSAMRRRRTWYEKNVERPLGRKRAPVWLPSRTPGGDLAEPRPLALVPPHEREDAVLAELAALAIEVLRRRIELGSPPADAVPEVLGALFGRFPDLPGDPARRPDLVAAVLRIIRER